MIVSILAKKSLPTVMSCLKWDRLTVLYSLSIVAKGCVVTAAAAGVSPSVATF